MTNNVVIVDSEFAAEVMHLNDGAAELKDIIREYKLILEDLTKEGITDKLIHNVLVDKVEKVNNAIDKIDPIINSVFTSTVQFLGSVEDKDKLK